MNTLADEIVDYFIATIDAMELRAELEQAYFAEPFREHRLSYLQEAVRRVTEWEGAGVYEAERAKLIKGLTPFYIPELDPNALAVTDRLTPRYEAADREEKKRIDLLFDFIEKNRLWDVAAILLEPVKKRPGGKKGRLYPGDVALLIEMKALVEGGMTIPKAAAQVAPRGKGASISLQDSVQTRLEKSYRACVPRWEAAGRSIGRQKSSPDFAKSKM